MVMREARILETAVSMIGCLAEQIVESELPELVVLQLMPGSEVPLDYCGDCKGEGNGQGWVRLIQTVPTGAFPEADVTGQQCHGRKAYTFEMGITRCLPVGKMVNQRFTPPTTEQMLNSTRLQWADMDAMERAIACCMRSLDDDLDYVLGIYTPLPTLGGCVGGTWTVTVG